MMTSPSQLDLVIPPPFVTRFDDGLAALRACFGVPRRSPDTVVRRVFYSAGKITVASPASPPITAPFRSKLCVPLPTLYQREGKAFAAQRVIRIGPHFLKKGSGGGGDLVQEVASKRQNRSGVGSCRSFRA
jgi:hypothetical protein